ncbi:MAG: hypothetical protein ACPLYD_15320, partial [Anaerolineae bacterium]
EAVRYWQEALQADPAHLEANFNYGYYRWEKAEIPGSRFLEEFLALGERHQSRSEYWDMLGWIYLEQGNVEELEKIYEHIRDTQLLGIIKQGCHPVIKMRKYFKGGGPVSFSPDGQYALFSGCIEEGFFRGLDTIFLIDLDSGNKLHPLYGGAIHSVAFSPNGDSVIFGDKKGILGWDIKAKGVKRFLGKNVKRWKISAEVRAIVFTLDGRYVISGGDDGTIRVWDASDPLRAREVRNWKVESVVTGVDTLDIAPSGEYLISGGYDNYVRLWDLKTGKEVRRMMVDDPISVRYMPYGNLALSGNGDSTLCLWDTNTGQPLLWFKAHTGYIVSVDVSPDGRFAISGSADRTARLWDLTTGKEIRHLKHGDQVTSVRFSADSKMAITSGGGFVYIWEVNFPTGWKGISIYPILCRSEGYIEIAQRRKKAMASLSRAEFYINAANYHEGYSLLRQVQTIPEYERDIHVINLLVKCAQKGIRSRLKDGWCWRTLEGNLTPISTVAISADGKHVISGHEDEKSIRIWDTQNGKQMYCLEGHRSGVGYVSMSRGKNLALSACGEILIIWDILKGKEIIRLVGRELRYFAGIQFASLSPQGHLALLQSGDLVSGTTYVYVWNITENTITRLRWLSRWLSYKQPEQAIFSPDERYIISLDKTNTVSLWDLNAISVGVHDDKVIQETRSLRSFSSKEIQGHITCFNISPDGQLAVFGSWDDSDGDERFLLTIWSLEKHQEICCLDGHRGIIRTAIFSPDGKFAISGSDDRTIKVWDLNLKQEVCCLQGHIHRVSSLAISESGNFLVSGSWDKTIRVWALDWDYDFPDPAD